MRAAAYVQNGPAQTMNKFVPQALNVPALRDVAVKRLAEVDAEMLVRFVKTRPDPRFVEPAISKFSTSGAFRVSEAGLEQLIIPLAKFLGPAEVGQVIDAFNENDQISWAAGASDLLIELLDSTGHIAADSQTHWLRLYKSLLSHDYYKEERGARTAAIAWKRNLACYLPELTVCAPSELRFGCCVPCAAPRD